MKKLAIVLLAGLAIVGCDDVARESAPVELVASVVQEVTLVDIADPDCPDLGVVELTSIVKNPVSDPTFLDIRLQRARISYRRTDGGTLVPESYVRTLSGVVTQGGTSELNGFQVFRAGAITEAPFASLLPGNGGVDPETGSGIVSMDVILEIFGETLSGEPVSARTEFPLDFCYNCGGCVTSGN